MTSKIHAKLILQTIREHANEQGYASWDAVDPVLETFGLEYDDVANLQGEGLIERGGEIGRLRLTPAGLRQSS